MAVVIDMSKNRKIVARVSAEDPRISSIPEASKRKISAVLLTPTHLIFAISAGFVAIFRRVDQSEFVQSQIIRIPTSSDLLFIHLMQQSEDKMSIILLDTWKTVW